MKLVEGLLCDWQRWTCSHRWVRARWDDGTYGMRCLHCMKPYRHTWEQIIGAPQPRAVRRDERYPELAPSLVRTGPEAAPVAEFPALRRVA